MLVAGFLVRAWRDRARALRFEDVSTWPGMSAQAFQMMPSSAGPPNPVPSPGAALPLVPSPPGGGGPAGPPRGVSGATTTGAADVHNAREWTSANAYPAEWWTYARLPQLRPSHHRRIQQLSITAKSSNAPPPGAGNTFNVFVPVYHPRPTRRDQDPNCSCANRRGVWSRVPSQVWSPSS